MKLFNELAELQLAKYANELRPILRRCFVKLSSEMGLSDEDVSKIIYRSRALVYEERSDGKLDTRYWKQFRDLFVELVCLMKKENHLGTPETLDNYIKNLYDPEISGKSISDNIYKIIRTLNANGKKVDHGVLVGITSTNFEYLPSPQTVVVGNDSTYFYTWSAVGAISDPEFMKEDPGLFIRGTALGVGDEGTVGLNKLNYAPIQQGSGPGGTYTSSSVIAATAMNAVSIPSTIPSGVNDQRWYKHCGNVNTGGNWVDDYRRRTYANCNWFATLPPGSYKLICECANPYAKTIRVPNLDSIYRNDEQLPGNHIPRYSLIDSANNIIVDVTWEDFFVSENSQKWTRKESVFNVSEPLEVGVFSKMYMYDSSYSIDNITPYLVWRIMIVPADTVATPFSVEVNGETITGESCWEPYSVSSNTISVKFTNLSDGEEYIKTVPIEGKLYETTMVVPLTSEISETIKAGPVKIEILSSDSEDNHGSLSTYYMR